MRIIQGTVRRILSRLGYDIRRLPRHDRHDLDLYFPLYGRAAVEAKRFYNVGAGGFSHPAWTNVDKRTDQYASLQGERVGLNWDLLLCEPLPLEDACAELVYSSHTIEHVTNEAVNNFFQQAYRILKPGGYLRIVCPDVDLAFRAVMENDRDFFYWIDNYSRPDEMARINITTPMNEASVKQVFLYLIAGSASILHGDGAEERISDEQFDALFADRTYEEALDYCISRCPMEIQETHPQNHVNWWNEAKIRDAFTKVGFSSVYRSGAGQSHAPPLRNTALFDNTHPKMSLFMEARK